MKRFMRPPRLILAILLILLLTQPVLTACGPAGDLFDPAAATPTPAPSDWLVISPDSVKHVAVPAIHADQIPLRKIELTAEAATLQVRPTADGGCLAAGAIDASARDAAGNPLSLLQITRFRADGSVFWQRQYDDWPFQGYLLDLALAPEGWFAVSIRTVLPGSNQNEPADLLLRFAEDGSVLWNLPAGQLPVGALEKIFAVPDGAALAVGTIAERAAGASQANNNISLLRIEADGSVTRQLSLGTDEYDFLADAVYAADTGLVLIWQKIDQASLQRRQIGCYDLDLNEKWINARPANENVWEIGIPASGSGIFAFGTTTPACSTGACSTISQAAVFHLTADGADDWSYVLEKTSTWIAGTVRLGDGRFVVGTYGHDDSDREISELVVLSAAGKVLSRTAPLAGTIRQLRATGDGGLISVQYQSVRTLPQPPYVSAIWIDTEAIVSRYDAKLQPIWRRTVDQYKYSLRTDLVVITAEDRLLAG